MRRHPQRGAALLVAMLVLTLVGTLAAGMVWQQSRALAVESAERARAQAGWILTGALDLGRVILRLDGRTPGADHLGEPWATPVPEASLSSLLAQDRNNTLDSAPEAYLRGGIVDAQSRYNLRNLVDAGQKIVEAELETLKRLCESAAVPPETADLIAKGLQAAWAPDSGSDDNAAIEPRTVAQLTWLGLDADTVTRLAPFVVLLPEATPVNINTASPEVIAGVIAGLDASSAKRIEQRRPFKTLEEVRPDLPGGITLDSKRIDVASRFFEVSGRLRIEDRELEERMLVQRRGRDIVPLSRERQSVLSAR